MRTVAFFFVASAAALLSAAGQAQPPSSPDEQFLQSAGLSTDGDALAQFFHERTRPTADFAELLRMARQLGDPSADKRASAKAKLLGSGPWAIPALRHVVNDLENPLAAQQARHCLDCLEGTRGSGLAIAAAKLLAARKPAEAAGALLTFLPFAGDPAVVDGVKTALDGIATRPGKTDAALLTALSDPLPLRRAVAAEVLAGSGRPEVLPEVRKLLADSKPLVRLRVALNLAQHLDEKAVGTLIDLLVELPSHERRQAEQALHQLAGAWSPTPPLTVDDDLARKICHEAWAAWWRSIDGPALTAAFRQRTLNEQEAAAAKALVGQLGSQIFLKRERAAAELIGQGTKVVGLLREASNSADPELAQRAGICLQAIAKNEAKDRLPLTAPRLLAIRKPAGASESLLAFLPFSDDRAMSTEVVNMLSMLVRVEGKPDVALLKALSDPLPMRRIAAAEALAGAGSASHQAVRKLLTDADPHVRLHAALALVHAQDKEAVPALIELVVDLPGSKAVEADELLRRLAGDKAPERPLADDPAARKNLKAAWLVWWKDHGATVDLAALGSANVHAGLIVVAELGPMGSGGKRMLKGGAGGILLPGGFGGPGGVPPGIPPPAGKAGGIQFQPGGAKKAKGLPMPANQPAAGTDRLIAVDRDGKVVWQIENLEHPKDFQLLPNGHILIAEYQANRVTERDLKGNILWEAKNLPAPPMNVQRLANGNTFIAMYGSPNVAAGYHLLEMDRQGKTVATFTGGAGGFGAPGVGRLSNPRAGFKMANGQMICIAAPGTVVRLDATGKELNRFVVPLLSGAGGVPSIVGNIDVTAKGHIVIAQNNNTVAEYDPDGKMVWQVQATGNRATRLANGNTLVASETTGVVELDNTGKTVWQYQPPTGYHAVRARQVSNVPLGVHAGGQPQVGK